MIKKTRQQELPSYFQNYLDLVPEEDLEQALDNSLLKFLSLLQSIPAEKENFTYAPGKWTIKEVLGHLIDSERIFAYRALRFSRKDNTELAGYSDDTFVANGNAKNRTLCELLTEFKLVRAGTLVLMNSLNQDMLDFEGVANGIRMSARTIGWLIAGHNLHHTNVLSTRYFPM
jgi:uncharacterized damage-inducible protein DinB